MNIFNDRQLKWDMHVSCQPDILGVAINVILKYIGPHYIMLVAASKMFITRCHYETAQE